MRKVLNAVHREFLPWRMVLLRALIIDVKAGVTPGRLQYLMQTYEQFEIDNTFLFMGLVCVCLVNQFDFYWLKSQVFHCATKTPSELGQQFHNFDLIQG